MNKEKRRNTYLQVKNYVKHRKKKLCFPLQPSLERYEQLRDDLKFLKQVNYETLSGRQSEIWAQRCDREEPVHVSTATLDTFWDLLYSKEWKQSSSLRVCEGALLTKLVEELYWLHHHGSLATYRMGRFDACYFPAARPGLKSSDIEPQFIAEPVKINFNVYFRPKTRWNSGATSHSSETRSVSKYGSSSYSGSMHTRSVDAGVASDGPEDSASISSEARSLPSVAFSVNQMDTVGNCINLSSLGQNDDFVCEDVESQDPDSPHSLSCLEAEKKSSEASTATFATKSSIQFKPSHESMESSEVVFIDHRYGRESDPGFKKNLFGFDEADEEWNTSRDRIIDSQLKYGFRAGLSWRRGAPVAVNVSGSVESVNKGMAYTTVPVGRSPCEEIAESRSGAIPPAPSFTPILHKVHPDRAALTHRFKTGSRCTYFNIKGKVLSTNDDLQSEEEASVRFSDENILSGPKAGVHVTDKEHAPGSEAEKAQNTVFGENDNSKVVEIPQEPQKRLDTTRLHKSYSIDRMRLWNLRKKQETGEPLPTLDGHRKKYVESALNEQLGSIYQKKGLLPKQESHKITLLFDCPRMREKARQISNYRNSTARAFPRPPFPKTGDPDFRQKLLQAARDFVIRKELVTCKGRPTITSVTFNKIQWAPLWE